jgi:hypothetical protein
MSGTASSPLDSRVMFLELTFQRLQGLGRKIGCVNCYFHWYFWQTVKYAESTKEGEVSLQQHDS